MKRLSIVCISLVLSACGGVAPYSFPDTAPVRDLAAIDASRIVVKQEFRYSPTLTSYMLPAGEYVPVRRDARGTFYESSRGILILPAAGTGHLEHGGIYRLDDATVTYPLIIYGGLISEPLHSMWGLDLNEKIACTPKCEFR